MPGRNGVAVGVDDSPSGGAALRYAVEQADSRGVPLTLVRAWQPSRGGGADSQTTNAALLRRAGLTVIRGLSGVQHRELLVQQPTLDALAQAGSEEALLVVGAGRRTGVSGRSTARLAARLAEAAPCPVVVVPDLLQRAGPVVLGVDGSAASGHAARFAFEAADRSNSRLRALLGYSSTEGHTGLDTRRRADLYDNATRVLAESLSGLCRTFPDVLVSQEVTADDPSAALLAASAAASLIVLGGHRHGSLFRLLLGSVSAGLLAQAGCPVTVVAAS